VSLTTVVMVAAVAARRQQRPATATAAGAGEVVPGALDGSGSVAAFGGGNGLRRGDGEREM